MIARSTLLGRSPFLFLSLSSCQDITSYFALLFAFFFWKDLPSFSGLPFALSLPLSFSVYPSAFPPSSTMSQLPYSTISLLFLLILLTVNTGVVGTDVFSPATMKLVKRDPSGVPATISHQNCATRYRRRYKSSPDTPPKCNPGIQVGECFVNAR